jgi:DNA polymerase III delta prime subunit
MKPTVWVEKYRPRSISEVIFQDDRQRLLFEKFVADGDMPNLLLSGIQGTGKTTISKALMRDLNVDKSDRLRINCSDKKIDALRSEVTAFAMTMPLGKFKVVQLEEFDYLSLDGQGLLRMLIEDTSASCRFIATCNYENKIIPPLKSRFQQFYFKAPDKDKIAGRMVEILDREKIQYDAGYLLAYIDVGYPDIRKTIQLLQGNIIGGELLNPSSASAESADWKFGLLDCIATGNFKGARKLVCESATREEHEDVFTFLYTNVEKMKVKDFDSAILIIAEHMCKHPLSADTEINLASMFIQLSRC